MATTVEDHYGLLAEWPLMRFPSAGSIAVSSSLASPPDSTATPSWVVHDRTHLELTHRYPLEAGASFEWEMYAFVPKSFRLRQQAYLQENLSDDLQSRFRLDLVPRPFGELRGVLPLLEDSARGDGEKFVREMQLFASAVRTTAVAEQRALLELTVEERAPRLELLLSQGRRSRPRCE